MRELLDAELDIVCGGNDDGDKPAPKKNKKGRWGWIVMAGEYVWGWISGGSDDPEEKEGDEKKQQ